MSVLRLPNGLVAWVQSAPARLDAGPGDTRARWSQLTLAELEVCILAIDGLSNADIAEHRAVSVRTVANLLATAYKKLGTPGRSDLASRYGRLARPGSLEA